MAITENSTKHDDVSEIYTKVDELINVQNMSPELAEKELIKSGLDAASASIVIESVLNPVSEKQNRRVAKKKKSPKYRKSYKDREPRHVNNDMIFGALWFIGGIIATASDIGFIFIGAIVFGLFQFIKGLITFISPPSNTDYY